MEVAFSCKLRTQSGSCNNCGTPCPGATADSRFPCCLDIEIPPTRLPRVRETTDCDRERLVNQWVREYCTFMQFYPRALFTLSISPKSIHYGSQLPTSFNKKGIKSPKPLLVTTPVPVLTKIILVCMAQLCQLYLLKSNTTDQNCI